MSNVASAVFEPICDVCIHHFASWCQVERMRRDEIGDFLEKECLTGEIAETSWNEFLGEVFLIKPPSETDCYWVLKLSNSCVSTFSSQVRLRLGYVKSLPSANWSARSAANVMLTWRFARAKSRTDGTRGRGSGAWGAIWPLKAAWPLGQWHVNFVDLYLLSKVSHLSNVWPNCWWRS